MALEEIIKKIDADAKSAVDKISTETEQDIQQLFSKAEQEAEQVSKTILAKSEEEAKRIVYRTLQQAELAGRKEILAAKQSALNAVFDKVEERLFSLDEAAYQKLLEYLIMQFKGEGEYKLNISKETAKIVNNEFVEKLNKQVKKAKAGFNLVLGKDPWEIDQGFVLQQHKLEVNFTFTALLSQARKAYYQDVVNQLLPEEE